MEPVKYLEPISKMHFTRQIYGGQALNGPPASPERLALAGMALRFDLKELAHPAAGGTPLSKRIDPPAADP